jgi:hypothetical protein
MMTPLKRIAVKLVGETSVSFNGAMLVGRADWDRGVMTESLPSELPMKPGAVER